MSELLKPATGELSLTVRTQVLALSVLPTQSSCHVEWAETDAAAASRTIDVFMLSGWPYECK
jgi:hypothetical protein